MPAKLTQEEFIRKSIAIHGDRYDYSLVKYNSYETNIIIICKEHGKFEQSPHNHLHKRGCKFCANNVQLTSEIFVKRAKIIHGDTYDYSLVEYKNWKTDIAIICKHHGVFKQRANNHLSGKMGCPVCKSSKGEKEVQNFLDKNNIHYSKNHKFIECKYIRPLPFDFYIEDFNTCIEYDGSQHYTGWHRNSKNLKEIEERDNVKTKYCLDNGIKLIRIKYTDYKNIKSILEKELLTNQNNLIELNKESVSTLTHADSVNIRR